MTDTLALARVIFDARFADDEPPRAPTFDGLSAAEQAVWIRCAEAAARFVRANKTEKSKDPAAARIQHLEEVVRRFRELCREAEAAAGHDVHP
ncbi:hypothetical protein [Phreatobacter sp. AB_2022a]|uniref:hypothetical protein n=1 Tax=Phreatobacter sp. AB_2022a TaxID=3003134 RepID=UPI002287028B|nr:hypothetical protein [Phreatobacter sp. AB_2022a]MCZ0737284.1 hypothetical protein [Phreatobacter sp. AB_2022a]